MSIRPKPFISNAAALSKADHIYLAAAAMSPLMAGQAGSSKTFLWAKPEGDKDIGSWVGQIGVNDFQNAARVANMLAQANHAALKYGADNGILSRPLEPDEITPEECEAVISACGNDLESFKAIQIIRACDHYCFRTQEYPEWPTSEAASFIGMLTYRATCELEEYKTSNNNERMIWSDHAKGVLNERHRERVRARSASDVPESILDGPFAPEEPTAATSIDGDAPSLG